MMSRISTIIATLTGVYALSLTAVIPLVTAEPPPIALRVAGLWRSGDGSRQILVSGLPTGAFIAKRNQLAEQGLAISAIAVYPANDEDNYVAIFEPTSNSETVTNLLAGTWEQFAAKDMEMFNKGFRLVDIALSIDPHDVRKVRYTGVWKDGLGTGAQWTDPAMSWDDFIAKAKDRFDKGLRLVAMDAIAVGGGQHKALFAGTWRDGQGTGALYFIPPSDGPEYNERLMKHFNNGLRSVAFSTYTMNGQTPMYVGAMRGGLGKPGEWNSPALKWDEFVAEHKSKAAQGYRLVDISVYMQFTKID